MSLKWKAERVPYCPNVKCSFHKIMDSEKVFWKRNGYFSSSPFDSIQRFRCLECGKNFSERSFQFRYRFKIKDPSLSSRMFTAFILGASNHGIARALKLSEHCVRRRLQRMAEWASTLHFQRVQKLTVSEALCYDGLENFAGSQYDPNHINQMLGKDSLFIYDFNFAPLNRKGKMSPRQKLIKSKIEESQGPYPKRAIRMATTALVKRMLKKIPEGARLTLISDEHFQYKRSIQFDFKGIPIEHITVSSKKTRNFQNILFPANHSDLLIRQNVGAFSRETISFAKTHARMCQKFLLFSVYKNYMAPQFTKAHVRRPKARFQSPAQALGLEEKLLTFGEFFNEKRTAHQIRIPKDWLLFINGRVPYSRRSNLSPNQGRTVTG